MVVFKNEKKQITKFHKIILLNSQKLFSKLILNLL
jgi:hypothetical protein